MGVIKYTQWLFICETCGDMTTFDEPVRKLKAISEIRKSGWLIKGDKTYCPKCKTE